MMRSYAAESKKDPGDNKIYNIGFDTNAVIPKRHAVADWSERGVMGES